ncbi:MAG: ABC transporter ATP-binding protein, partial [Gemmatimonadota bacterium]
MRVAASPERAEAHIEVRDLTMAYGDLVLMRDVTFTVQRGDIFFIIGGSGSGKSTLLRHMIGLLEPASGEVRIAGERITGATLDVKDRVLRRVGILYQGGGLWSSMTLAENVAVPLEEFTDLPREEIGKLVSLKLSLVGLRGFEKYYPSELSGGMQRRAGLARSLALDPDILFLDEPSAGLDPLTSRRLDDLVRELRDSLGATVVIVSHELPSIFGIGTNCVFLDAETRSA